MSKSLQPKSLDGPLRRSIRISSRANQTSGSSTTTKTPVSALSAPIPPHSPYEYLKWKQDRIKAQPPTLPKGVKHPDLVVSATLAFAREEAGTAICISPNGVILTCAHCIGETIHDFDINETHVLLTAAGDIVKAEAVAWDPVRDLALLIVVESPFPPNSMPCIPISSSTPKRAAKLLCIGAPCTKDLDPSQNQPIAVTEGTYHGLAPGQDPLNNERIGALIHDCWTYWGHSGAPLLDRSTGHVVGLHSSWDESTGLRRGVGWEAMTSFLEERRKNDDRGEEEWKWFVQG